MVIAARALVGLIIVRQMGGSDVADDPKKALDQTLAQVKQEGELSARDEIRLRIELAMGDYMARNGKLPTSINDLVPTYFDTVPIDPSTDKPFNYPSDELDSGSGTGKAVQTAAVDSVQSIFADGAFVNPNTMKESEFVYDSAGKRDPFDPFDFSGGSNLNMDLPPLERYSIGQLKVTAILRDTKKGTYNAFVEDVTGIGYPVIKGSRVGDNDGVVVRITEDAVFVVESKVDFTGKKTRATVEMKIQRKKDGKNPNFQKARSRR